MPFAHVAKFLFPLFSPIGLAVALSVLAWIAFLRNRKGIGSGCLLASILVLWVCSVPVFSDPIRTGLERRYLPVPVSQSRPAEAIVVLGGCTGSLQYPRVAPDINSSSDRIWRAARLFRAGKAPLVVASGGITPWLGTSPEAVDISRLLQEFGVPGAVILLEDRSRNTRENAVYTRLLLEKRGLRRILLVTSALHMRRALATFRTAGLDAIPSPTDYEVIDRPQTTILDFLPDAEALYGATRAIREYLGFIVYRWQGYIE